MSVKERLKEYIDFKGLSIRYFCESIGVSSAYVTSMRKSIQPDKLEVIALQYPDLNVQWLLTGEGEMQKFPEGILGKSNQIVGEMLERLNIKGPFVEEGTIAFVPLLPIAAQGGTLNDFVVSVKDSDCEKIISPIKGADFAITVSGESMAPEYPSGSKILIKKINEKSFIEWGRCYVLDTYNGVVIKKLDAPVEEDPRFGFNYVICVSVNPAPIYKPFRVPTEDIIGMYRVLMLLTEK